jgi:hypothetical protein
MSLNAQPINGFGMWVWSNSAFSTQKARQQLVQFCVQNRISHLDVHTKMFWKGVKPILKNSRELKDLILLAGEHNITTAILRGNPQMFFSKNHEQTLSELHAIIDFSETLPSNSLFKGIKYDVEPYRTEEWKAKGPTREAVMRDYLTFLRKARSVLHEETPRLWLAVDTPFWWDNDEFILEFKGKRKRFSEHVQDLTDFIVIMSYRRSARKILACGERERMYAQWINKVISLSLETIKLKKNPHISFWRLSTEEFWKVVNQLQEIAKKDPVLDGVMIHNYRGLVEKFYEDTPNK